MTPCAAGQSARRPRTVESASIRVEAARGNAERLALIAPGRYEPVAPTHWSFGQLCTLVGASAAYLRQLPAPLSAINLQHGLLSRRAGQNIGSGHGRIELRAGTGPEYGRIWDHQLGAAVMQIAGNGSGDTRLKVLGVLDWLSMTHNPFVDVTKDTTTLYASDRDVFLFLVDDTNLIEAGRLPDGSPDVYYRSFYCWNSEVGSKALGIASFYVRAVCMNRNLWGVENLEQITIRHSKFAARRSAHKAAPGLTSFANSSPVPFVAGIAAARQRIVARTVMIGRVSCARIASPKPRHRRSLQLFLARRTASRRASLTSCRTSRLLHAARRIKTRGSSSKARPSV